MQYRRAARNGLSARFTVLVPFSFFSISVSVSVSVSPWGGMAGNALRSKTRQTSRAKSQTRRYSSWASWPTIRKPLSNVQAKERGVDTVAFGPNVPPRQTGRALMISIKEEDTHTGQVPTHSLSTYSTLTHYSTYMRRHSSALPRVGGTVEACSTVGIQYLSSHVGPSARQVVSPLLHVLSSSAAVCDDGSAGIYWIVPYTTLCVMR